MIVEARAGSDGDCGTENDIVTKRVKFQEMLSGVRRGVEDVPEHRGGRNVQYQIADAGLAAFSVFYIQSPSFLAYQRQTEEQRAQNNARSLFGVETIPSDGQMRNLLDPVEPSYLRAPFWEVYELLQVKGHLEAYASVSGTLLCSLDGTRFFASQKIRCAHCTVHVHDGQQGYKGTIILSSLLPFLSGVLCLSIRNPALKG